MTVGEFTEKVEAGVIASCQARRGSPMRDPLVIAALAKATVLGGARGVRIDSPEHIKAVRHVLDVPIVGIFKRVDRAGTQWITPTRADAAAVAEAGASVIAVDATERPRTIGDTFADLTEFIHEELQLPVMADVDSVSAGIAAFESGADLVATTLAGYVGNGAVPVGPDIGLVSELVSAVEVPVVAEGRYSSSQDVLAALANGALTVVVGTALTDTEALTRELVASVQSKRRT